MKRHLALLLLLALPFAAGAQLWDQLCREQYRPDSTQTGLLAAEINTIGFFKDNEYGAHIMKGYSLPGAWVQPKLTYQPLDAIRLELGAHALLFNGANKYPCYAYHDIGRWKGQQYQRGLHVLPFLRARASLSHLTFVLGNIYGAQNHGLIDPLYNPEQNISADPEMGFQMLLDRRHVHMDLWLNWQSYIFEEDSHQEAFTVGANTELHWQRSGSPLRWSVPVQLLIQHRGGEQDTTSMGVQTLCNASLGLRLDYLPRSSRALTRATAEANLLSCYQQSGHLWPFQTGLALHAAAGLTLWNRLGLRLGHLSAPRQFANLYGIPFFGTISTKEPGLTFRKMNTTYLTADYIHEFTSAYKLGARIDAYAPHTLSTPSSPSVHAFCFDFALYLRLTPTFSLHRHSSR